MSTLVTGASGFLGKNLVKMLNPEDTVCISSKDIPGFRTILHKGHCYEDLNLADEKIDRLLLLGAITPKGSQTETVEDYISNITSTLSLLRALSQVPKRIVFTSSVSVYARSENVINEESALNSEDAYALSKILCEKLLLEYCGNHNTELCIARLGNIYGEGEDTYKKLVGTFLSKALRQEKIEIFSDGRESRNLIYVGDVCRFLKTQVYDGFQGIVNVVSRHEYSVLEVAEKVKRAVGSESEISVLGVREGRYDHYDAAKLYSIADGFCETSLEEGIKRMLDSWGKQGV